MISSSEGKQGGPSAAQSRPTLAQLFDLPQQVGAQDFVVKLADAVRQPQLAAKEPVVTKQLAACFDEALTLVQGSLTEGKSRAAYLHLLRHW